MPDRLLRYGVIAMLVVAALAVLVTLARATSGPTRGSAFERFKQGEFAALDFSEAGEPAPEAVFAGPEGDHVSLPEMTGRLLLVNYWATWCAPCERELPSLGALQTARGGDRFTVVAISVDPEKDAEAAAQRLSELTGGVLDFHHAPDYAPVYPSRVRGFPTSIVYDAEGRELFRLAGEADWAGYEALALIDAAIGD